MRREVFCLRGMKHEMGCAMARLFAPLSEPAFDGVPVVTPEQCSRIRTDEAGRLRFGVRCRCTALGAGHRKAAEHRRTPKRKRQELRRFEFVNTA